MQKADSLQKVLEHIAEEHANIANNQLLEELFIARAHSALEEMLKEDERYRKMNEKTKKELSKLDNCHLSHEQWARIDEVLSLHNSRSSEYGCKAYILGFKDAVTLFMQIYHNSFFK